MGLKTNLIVSGIFLGLLAFVYFHEIKGGEERRLEAERAKQLMEFSDHEARGLVIERGDSTIAIEKLPDRWVLQKPVQTDADQSAVERYLRALRETEVERIIEDSAAVTGDPGLLDRYGLDQPRLKVLLELVEGPRDTVLLGEDTPTERFAYARRSGDNPQIFTVRAWRFDNLDKGTFDLRDRRVLAFEKEEVRQIRLTRSAPGDTVRLARESDGEWTLESPVAARADETSVRGMLNRLRDGKAEEFVAENPEEEGWREYGLTADLARLQVSLLLGDELAEKRLVVGLQAPGGDYYARDPSRAPVIRIDSALVHNLEKSIFELRDKRPLRLDRDGVRRLELVRRGEQPLVAERDSTGTWSILEPELREAKSWRLNSLLTDIDAIEVKEFVADGADLDLGAYGLSEPAVTVTVGLQEEPSLEVRLGNELDGGVYLTRWGSSAVFLVDAEIVEMLNLELTDVAQPPAPAPADTVAAGG